MEGPIPWVVRDEAEDHPGIRGYDDGVATVASEQHRQLSTVYGPQRKAHSQHRRGVVRHLSLPPSIPAIHDPKLPAGQRDVHQRSATPRTHLVPMQVEWMVAVVQVVDDHLHHGQVVDGRHQLRPVEVVRARRRRVAQVAEQARRVRQRLPRLSPRQYDRLRREGGRTHGLVDECEVLGRRLVLAGWVFHGHREVYGAVVPAQYSPRGSSALRQQHVQRRIRR